MPDSYLGNAAGGLEALKGLHITWAGGHGCCVALRAAAWGNTLRVAAQLCALHRGHD